VVNVNSVVLLNADYSFLNIVTWQKAMVLFSKGKVECVKYSERVIRTAKGKIIKIPAVMRLIKFIRTLYKTRVPYSKRNVMVRDGFKCAYCGETKGRLTIDHIIPKAKGGKSTFENTITSCKPCNNKKGDRSCHEVKMYPKGSAFQPTISQFLTLKMNKLGINKVIEDVFNGI